jgi:hypothetical protein
MFSFVFASTLPSEIHLPTISFEGTNSHQRTLHWKATIMTHLQMNPNQVDVGFHLGNQM